MSKPAWISGLMAAAVAMAATLATPEAAEAFSQPGAFVNFESGQVRPLAMSPSGNRLFVVNTPDNRLSVYLITASGLVPEVEIGVGMEPVSVRAATATGYR